MCSTSQSNHSASRSCAASSTAAPRSDAIVRSPSDAIETTTPVRPPTGPTTSTPRSRSSRATSSPAASSRASSRIAPRHRVRAPRRRRSRPARRPARVVATGRRPASGSSRLDDHVQQQVAKMVTARVRSRMDGTSSGAGPLVRARRPRRRRRGSRRRPSSRRVARRPRDAPGGLVAFEDAPCFLEIVGERRSATATGARWRPGRRTRVAWS